MFSACGDIDYGRCLCLRNSGRKGDCCVTHPVCFSAQLPDDASEVLLTFDQRSLSFESILEPTGEKLII